MTCYNHPDRIATELCVSCGHWYCDQCMIMGNLNRKCNNCNSSKLSSNAGLFNSYGTYLLSNVKFIGISVFSISLGVSILLLYIINKFNLHILYLPLLLLILTNIFFFWLVKKYYILKGKKHINLRKITIDQVDSLLRISNNTLTIKRLASATNTNERAAEAFLKKLVLNNYLEVYPGNDELIYRKRI